VATILLHANSHDGAMSPKIILTGVDLEVYSVDCANYRSTDLTSDNGHLLGYWPPLSFWQNFYCKMQYHVRFFGNIQLPVGHTFCAYCSEDDPGKDINEKNPCGLRQRIHCSEIQEFSVELHMCYLRRCTKRLRMSVLIYICSHKYCGMHGSISISLLQLGCAEASAWCAALFTFLLNVNSL
jgi:hypothetical protein